MSTLITPAKENFHVDFAKHPPTKKNLSIKNFLLQSVLIWSNITLLLNRYSKVTVERLLPEKKEKEKTCKIKKIKHL